MADLRALLNELGCTKVQTYIQSGNVLLETDISSKALATKVKAAIATQFGFEVPCLVFSWEDLKQGIAAMPFEKVEEQFIHLTFLEKVPDCQSISDLNIKLLEGEQYEIIDQSIYLYCPKGYGRTKLNNHFWEKQLGLSASTRNWKTCKKLLEMGKK